MPRNLEQRDLMRMEWGKMRCRQEKSPRQMFELEPVSTGQERTNRMHLNAAKLASTSGCQDRPYIRSMFTYFIQLETGGPIKIGKSANIPNRLRSMQCGSPVTYVCIAFVKGDREARLHEKFNPHCIGGEWFHDCAEIREFIAKKATPACFKHPALSPQFMLAKSQMKLRGYCRVRIEDMPEAQ